MSTGTEVPAEVSNLPRHQAAGRIAPPPKMTVPTWLRRAAELEKDEADASRDAVERIEALNAEIDRLSETWGEEVAAPREAAEEEGNPIRWRETIRAAMEAEERLLPRLYDLAEDARQMLECAVTAAREAAQSVTPDVDAARERGETCLADFDMGENARRAFVSQKYRPLADAEAARGQCTPPMMESARFSGNEFFAAGPLAQFRAAVNARAAAVRRELL